MTNQERINAMVDLMRGAQVWKPQGQTTLHAHPLYGTWLAMTVICPITVYYGKGVCLADCPRCHGTGRVARDVSGLTDGMLKGFVFECLIGTDPVIINFYQSVDEHFDALDAAIRAELGMEVKS
jgi:hypothetical protein